MKISSLFLFLIFLFTVKAACQNKEIRLIGGGGFSSHGTGDLPGYNYLNQVDVQLSKRIFVSPGIQFTNHSKREILTNELALNFVTTGVNIFTNINYLIINNSGHHIALGGGPLLRLESSSYPNQTGININNSGDQILTIKYDKLHSTSVGYNITPSYYYQTSKKLLFGVRVIFQNDTKGDAITSSLIFAGIKL